MHLAIFGATGTVGSELVSQALAAGHRVRALARDVSKLGLDDPRLEIVCGDAMDTAAVAVFEKTKAEPVRAPLQPDRRTIRLELHTRKARRPPRSSRPANLARPARRTGGLTRTRAQADYDARARL
jgi:hypothetical protein